MSDELRNEVPPQEQQQSKMPKEKIWLITLEQFNQLPDGVELTDTFGEKKVKGKDYIPLDTKGEYICFGFSEKDKPAGIEFNEKATWKVRERIWLITPEQFNQLSDGVELTDSFGEKKVKGKDYISLDTTGRYIGLGFLEKDKPAGIEFNEKATCEVKEN